MPETTMTSCGEIAERIRRDAGTILVPSGPVTTSIGTALWRVTESVEVVFKRCDEALYRAKDQGRNRVEAAV